MSYRASSLQNQTALLLEGWRVHVCRDRQRRNRLVRQLSQADADSAIDRLIDRIMLRNDERMPRLAADTAANLRQRSGRS
jgi:hypothetical protein